MKKKYIILLCVLFFRFSLFAAHLPHAEEAKDEHEWRVIRQGIINYINQDPKKADTHGVAAYDSLPMLHCAEIHKDTEICEFLLNKKADPNILDKDGKPALYKTNSLDVAKLLLNHKASVDIRVQKFPVKITIPILHSTKTPRANQRWLFDSSGTDEYEENDISSSEPEDESDEMGTEQIDGNGKGPLHLAAVYHHSKEKFSLLTSCGCEPRDIDEYGNTALITLMIHRNQDDVLDKTKTLLARVPDMPAYLRVKNHHGITAMDIAGEFSPNLKHMARFKTFKEYQDKSKIKFIPQNAAPPPKQKSPTMCDRSALQRKLILLAAAEGVPQAKLPAVFKPTRSWIPED